ncbi:MAG: toprim domain-containing protein [Planctomycetes bacterium]|nr:toprim domain-containing protein [Planctomycetota bacterium]
MSRFEEAKRLNRLEDVLAADGVVLKKTGRSLMARCPLPGHDDSTPSFSVLPGKQTFKCFGCSRSGSVIDYVAFRDSVSPEEAVHRLLMGAKGHDQAERVASKIHKGNGTPAPPSFPPSRSAAALLGDVADYYHRALADSPAARQYLSGRGLGDPATIRRFRIGFAAGTLVSTLASDGVQETSLRELGILTARGREHFLGMVVVPIPALDGQGVAGFYGRRIEDRDPKHLYLKGGHRSVLNAEAAPVYPDQLVLSEKILDMLSFWVVGIPNAIPCYGASGFTSVHEHVLREAAVRRAIVAFDRDEPGIQGAERVARRLADLGIEAFRLEWPEGVKDANEFLTREIAPGRRPGREEFAQLLAEAKPFAPPAATVAVSPAAPTPATSPAGAPATPATPAAAAQPAALAALVSVTDEEAVFAFPDTLYTVCGLDRIGRDAMRVVVTAESAGKSHTDRLDLYLSRSRRSFALALQGRFDLPAVRVEEDLSALRAALAELHRRKRVDALEARAVPPMTADAEREARELLAAPDLLDRVRDAYLRLGVAGEDDTKTLAYLVATSRKLDRPLSLILRSASAAGKSTLLEKTVELMPPEETEYLSRVTQAALYYVDALALRHRLLVVDERAGSAEADYALRSLQSRREISLAVPQKTPSGGMKTRILTVYGPTAIMESTTADEIHDENANRAWVAPLDEAPDATRLVHAAQKAAWAHAGRNGEAERTRILRLFQNAQRLLAPVTVQIPFAPLLAFPAEWTRARRDLDRFLGLVAASAFLHQYRRERLVGEPPVVLAALDDYAIAYGLARRLLAGAYAEISAPAAALLATIRREVERLARAQRVEPEEIVFRRRDVREWSRLPDHQVKRLMRQIEDFEYIETVRRKSGSSHRYRLLDAPAAAGSFDELTTPEDLARAIAETAIPELRQKRDNPGERTHPAAAARG